MKFILPVAAMICTGFVTLTAIVFCAGMGANASPAEIRALKFWMSGLGLLGLAGIVVSMLLMRNGQFGLAAGVAILPSAIMLLIFIIALMVK